MGKKDYVKLNIHIRFKGSGMISQHSNDIIKSNTGSTCTEDLSMNKSITTYVMLFTTVNKYIISVYCICTVQVYILYNLNLLYQYIHIILRQNYRYYCVLYQILYYDISSYLTDYEDGKL